MKKIKKILLVLFAAIALLSSAPVWAEEIPEIVEPAPQEIEDAVTLSSIAITTSAEKLTYIVGESLDITGLAVTGTYSDGNTKAETVTADNITGFDSTLPVSEQVLTITVGGQTVTYVIDILAASSGENTGDAGEETPLSVEESIVLQNGCEVEDTSGETHIFPETASSAEYTAICALAEALEQGFVDDIDFVDFGFGLFVRSINGFSEENTYWQLQLNGVSASVGAAELEVEAGNTVSLVLTEFDPITFAETPLDQSISVTIESLDPVFNNIVLPDRCSVTDTAGLAHEFPEESSSSDFLAICALAEALEQGFVDDIDFVDFGFGLFVDNLNDSTKPENSYWQFQLNGIGASVGVAQASVEAGDIVSLVLTAFDPETFEEEAVEPAQIFAVRTIALESVPEEEEEPGGGNGGGGNDGDENAPQTFSVNNAVSYLEGIQGTDGSFGGSSMYTDWAAIAYGAAEVSGSAKSSLISYMRSNNSISSLITDNERRAMALLALGENPYSFDGVNYIGAIVGDFDGTQFGDEDLVNDDIFALIPLQKAGYDEGEDMIAETIDFILSKQRSNGSWEGSVDVTAAAIQALEPFESAGGVSQALQNAENYIINAQGSDGGWENISSTSWALQAESALSASWKKNGKGGLDYLASKQNSADNNGAVLPASDSVSNVIWATSYAVPAGLGKPWSEILESVSMPKEDSGGSDNESQEEENPTETATPDTETPPVVLAETETDPAPVIPPLPVLDPAITLAAETENLNESSEEPENEGAEIAPETLTAGALNAVPPSDSPLAENLPLILGSASGIILLYGVAKLFIL